MARELGDVAHAAVAADVLGDDPLAWCDRCDPRTAAAEEVVRLAGAGSPTTPRCLFAHVQQVRDALQEGVIPRPARRWTGRGPFARARPPQLSRRWYLLVVEAAGRRSPGRLVEGSRLAAEALALNRTPRRGLRRGAHDPATRARPAPLATAGRRRHPAARVRRAGSRAPGVGDDAGAPSSPTSPTRRRPPVGWRGARAETSKPRPVRARRSGSPRSLGEVAARPATLTSSGCTSAGSRSAC